MALAAAFAPVAAGAQGVWGAFDPDDSFLYRQPPLSLPEGINGVVRASARPARVEAIDSIRDVFATMRACWSPPSGVLSGQQITLRLAFKRSGELIGPPRVTYYRAGASEDERELFTRSVRDAFAACLPLRLSPRLAAAVAGRPFTFRFVDDRPT